jgi:L-threonylcarbamoyladenylate synthase
VSSEIDRAVEILRKGGLVAFATETVYGLGADATDPSAVQKIFAVKGRPSTNPLICHVADAEIAKRYAAAWPSAATKLTERFWPGPLTIVLPKTMEIVPEVTAGLDTVGLRAPNHPLTLELLRAFDKPLAGPSANKSTHVSPTTAEHVRHEFGPEVDLILDGGACEVGIESTVLSLACDPPTILRPGGLSREQIETIIGPVEMHSTLAEVTIAARAPGQHRVHYAPRTPTYRFEPSQRHQLDLTDADVLSVDADAEAYARQLYSRLRELDSRGLRAMYVEMPPDTPQWAAVRDRLLRATKPLSDAR